jgi:hypothetical protein
MAVSQQYLHLVEQLGAAQDSTIYDCWKNVIHTFNNQDHTGEDEKKALLDLANVAFQVYNELTGLQPTDSKKKLRTTHVEKNNAYSGMNADPWYNFKQSLSFFISPYTGVLVRLSDKYQRYTSLCVNGTLSAGEAKEDTLLDLCSYALIAICLLREEVAACME